MRRIALSHKRVTASLLALLVGMAVWIGVDVLNASPSAFPSQLGEVSCGSSVACTAIGWSWQGDRASSVLAEFEGRSLVSTNVGADEQYGAVSCARPSWCMVLGRGSFVRDRYRATAEIDSHGQLTAIPGPPLGLQSLSLSCTSHETCMAVGPVSRDTAGASNVAWWNGKSWQRVTSSPGITYNGVSCAGKVWCIVIGVRNDTRYEDPVAALWTGSSLRSVRLPGDSALDTYLAGISCVSQDSCLVIAQTEGGIVTLNPGGVVYKWDGRHFAIESAPIPPDAVDLQSVSCVASVCMIVGERYEGPCCSNERLVGYELSGGSWTATPPVQNSAWSLEGAGGLISVSCPTTMSCVAVGPISIGRLDAGLIERWNGTSWVAEVGPRGQPPPVIRKGV